MGRVVRHVCSMIEGMSGIVVEFVLIVWKVDIGSAIALLVQEVGTAAVEVDVMHLDRSCIPFKACHAFGKITFQYIPVT